MILLVRHAYVDMKALRYEVERRDQDSTPRSFHVYHIIPYYTEYFSNYIVKYWLEFEWYVRLHTLINTFSTEQTKTGTRKTTNHLHLPEIVCNIPRGLLRQASGNSNVDAHVAVSIVGKVSQPLFENLPLMLVPRGGTHLPPSIT